MLDIDKSKEILENYFANVTKEQFAIDLEKYCPELVEAESASLTSDEFDNSPRVPGLFLSVSLYC